jgi:hypothetical protein
MIFVILNRLADEQILIRNGDKEVTVSDVSTRVKSPELAVGNIPSHASFKASLTITLMRLPY